MDKNTNSYSQRNSGINIAEVRFEEWCEKSKLEYWKTGFNEKEHPVKNFWCVHPYIRALPDYLVMVNNDLVWIHVKGSNKIKVDDLTLYEAWVNLFLHKTRFSVAFCLKDKDPIFLNWKELKKKLTGTTIKEWHDNKQYVVLDLC